MLTETEEQLKFYWHPAKTIDRSFRQESFVPESGAMAFESGPRLTPSAHSSSRRGRRGNNGEISEKCETWLESACHPDSRCHEPASRELSAHRVHGTTMHVHRPSLRSEYRPRASSTSASSILRSLTSISAHGIAISDFRSLYIIGLCVPLEGVVSSFHSSRVLQILSLRNLCICWSMMRITRTWLRILFIKILQKKGNSHIYYLAWSSCLQLIGR